MSRQAFSTVHISPEQERAVRLLYETFNQAKSPDRRILVAALAEAFMNGMTTQEQLFLVSTDFVVNSADHSEMFRNCTSLVGGNGTKYDEDHIDGTYARIDTANEPGYFTSNLGL